jgi:hypothetical protein
MGHDMKGGMGGARIFRISDEEEAPVTTPKKAVKNSQGTDSGGSANTKFTSSSGGEDEEDSDTKTPSKKRKVDADEGDFGNGEKKPKIEDDA